jgi:ubiquinone/menaquinone biosynthesis C-methylase UbiE
MLIGCGSAHWARELVNWSAQPENLFGVDLTEDQVEAARRLCAPGVTIDCGSALELHHADRSMDVVML